MPRRWSRPCRQRVGLGNIAGVCDRHSPGWPRSPFVWMTLAGFLGHGSTKFCGVLPWVRNTALLMSQAILPVVPCITFPEGLSDLGRPFTGQGISCHLLGLLPAGGRWGAAICFQANQSFYAVSTLIPALAKLSSLVMALTLAGVSRPG